MHYPLIRELLHDGAIVVVTSREPIVGEADRQSVACTIIQPDGDTVTQLRRNLSADLANDHRHKLDHALAELGQEVRRLRRQLWSLSRLFPIVTFGVMVCSGGALAFFRTVISWWLVTFIGECLAASALALFRRRLRKALRTIIRLP